ncbi:DinB family protein [Flavobacterium sp. XS2P39]|uniref:DinB family protein n=1 Tax=Flavobacterium sp. XS2P39 TaxID=3401725 RepID=UPI003AABCBBF
MKNILVLLTLILAAANSNAQTASDVIVKDWERAKAYTREYLDAMPETGYSFKPTKEMRSFSGQVLHLSDAIYGFVGSATDEKPAVGFGDLEKSGDENKASVTGKVMAAYDFAINAIKKYPNAKLSEPIKLFGKFDMNRAQVLDKCFEHQTHHRAQTTVYLRLVGATPPAEKLF